MPPGGGASSVTVTEHSALSPLEVFTLITAVPAFTAVTVPVWETVTTSAFELDHDTDLSVALSGRILTSRVVVCPSSNDMSDSLKVTLVTATVLFPPVSSTLFSVSTIPQPAKAAINTAVRQRMIRVKNDFFFITYSIAAEKLLAVTIFCQFLTLLYHTKKLNQIFRENFLFNPTTQKFPPKRFFFFAEGVYTLN